MQARRLLIALLTALCLPLGTRAQILAIKSDVLLDAAMVPNLGAEVCLSNNRFTAGVSCYGAKKVWGQDMMLLGAVPEIRYWLKGTPFDNIFVGAAGMGVHYDMLLGREKFKGDALGVGLTFGYGFRLSAYHWTAELSAGVATLYYRHHHQWKTDYLASPAYNQSGMLFMPFRVGFTVCYVFRYKGEVDSKKTPIWRKVSVTPQDLPQNGNNSVAGQDDAAPVLPIDTIYNTVGQ